MKLGELKNHLKGLESVSFRLPDETSVREHFHVTEVGLINKHFIDCGGTIRRYGGEFPALAFVRL